MGGNNGTSVEEFILLGFSHFPHLRLLLICVFSCLYICTLLWNSLIILLIIKDSQLHTPMYFFLANLSFLDIISPSITMPKMITDLVSKKGVLPYSACIAQLYLTLTSFATESNVLSAMAFDRYVAICKPLQYTKIMSHKMCCKLACGSWLLASVVCLMLSLLTNSLDFCCPNQINHFFCDLLPLLYLACSDITLTLILVYASDIIIGICNCVVIFSSYISIAIAIKKIKSHEGRKKAFLTCISHIVVVSMYYGTTIVIYLHEIKSYAESKNRAAALIYTTVTPLLNPLIYSLRNNDVKNALKKFFFKSYLK
ncbi:olfactory receptor 154-like [Xenopus laevis]|uniref:Olfactory receptor n=2 Tax=Xenopus laevis TaxID=8355 RepID=A0A974C185_XENLA|nr:olfactory receptor 154-like [Xenopus laevis]OCT64690.1 hypothetical protein XELAEV_18045787mg [Xenopus laevis]